MDRSDTTDELPIRSYHDHEDFDEAFKNLLCPIESITKKSQCESLQYNLIKELDSYLTYLKSTDTCSPVFVEAALVFQNVTFIYQKKVDHLVDIMAKLIGKFRAYRMNQKDIAAENVDGNNKKKKRKEKNVDFYSSFEPIKGQIFSTLKSYDCKLVNLSKKPSLPKIVLNANIKVDNKYNQVLPYIYVGNGDNIGKKYDFLLSYPLNRELAVNEEFDCTTNKDENNATPINYKKSIDPLPINLMNVDEISSNDMLPNTEDPFSFNQIVTDEVHCANKMSSNPENILNVSQISPGFFNDTWAIVKCAKDDIFQNINIVKKKVCKKKDSGIWLPDYTIEKLSYEFRRSLSKVDPAFMQFVYKNMEFQKSEISKLKIKHTDHEEVDENRENEEPDVDDNIKYTFNKQNESLEDSVDNRDNFETYQKNIMDMQKHKQNQLDIMNENLEMRKRVESWHDALRPVLEEEEKRTEFDIYQYKTQLLDCFQSLGEQMSFKDLVGGLEKEEVARYFLSTLMMANTSNLEIMKSSDNTNEIEIKVLKKEIHHMELQINIGNQVNENP